MLKGYFDESRRSVGAEVFALAGYVSHVNYWRRLSSEWNNILASYGIKHGLHMKDFAHFIGEFRIFKDNEVRRREFIGKLVRTLYKSPKFVAVGCAVDIHAFSQLPKGKTTSFRNDPYLFASLICARAAIECVYFRYLPASEKIGFVFDRRDDLQARALSIFNVIKSFPGLPEKERLGDIAFGSRLESPPLQAADFVAYEVRKALESRRSGEKERWGIGRIKAGPSCGVYIFDKATLWRWFGMEDGF